VTGAPAPLLDVRQLSTWFRVGGRWSGRGRWLRAVDEVDLHVGRGQIVALVGESGSGKTTLGRSILRLVEPNAGSIMFDGVDVRRLRGRALRTVRRRMQVVFQDPYAALSPRMQVRQAIVEPLRLHGMLRPDPGAQVAELLDRVGLEPYMMDRYPHEMSGGQRQRVAIARALSLRPEFIVADEPVSALDVSVRAQILNILLRLQREDGISILLVSHDLGIVDRVADRVAVMYGGRIVEEGPVESIMASPLHPYTRALLSAVAVADPDAVRVRTRLPVLPGEAPGDGCAFARRCPEAFGPCASTRPVLRREGGPRSVACHLYARLSPVIQPPGNG
jgi:oligopeptide/dipeptide ABC transporter ATP-binding protein